MGWIPDYPDIRDYTEETEEVKSVLGPTGVLKVKGLPVSVDLREWYSPVEDQGALGSCTAHARVGVIEYYERKSFGRHIDASRLFLYKVTRNLMKMKGDTGAYLRTTIGAMVLFGVPLRSIGLILTMRRGLTRSLRLSVTPSLRITRRSSIIDTTHLRPEQIRF